MERFAKLAVQALNTVLESPVQIHDLEIPPDPQLGDFAFPCFKLAKQFKVSPPQVSQRIVADLRAKTKLTESLELASIGPYVNFTAPAKEALSALLRDILAGSALGSYGALAPQSRGTWVLEYS